MSALSEQRKKQLFKLAAGLLGASVVYLFGIQQIVRYLAEHASNRHTPWIAGIPIVVLMLAMVWAMRSLRRMDELERRMHTEAMAFAFLGSLFLICSAGFLALAGVLTLSISWIAPAMALCWNIGLLIALKRYH